MKCYLHIGTEKTATTTLQRFFDINRKKLFADGYAYTKSAGVVNNRALPVAAYNKDRRDDFTKINGLNSDADLEKFQKKLIRNVRDEIKSLAKNCSTVIFSSEHIQSRLTEVEEVARLKDVLHQCGLDEVSVVVYLRRPADIANSLYSTALKAGRILDEPPSPKGPYWRNICHHRQTLERFGSVFGRDSMRPRLFDRKAFAGGSIVSDMLGVIGIPNADAYEIPPDANESLSPLGIEILRRLNRKVPKFIDNEPNPARSNITSYLERHFSDGKYVMPEALYQAYMDEFRESNEWVRSHYFPSMDKLFSDDIPGARDRVAYAEADIEAVASLIADLWHDRPVPGSPRRLKIMGRR